MKNDGKEWFTLTIARMPWFSIRARNPFEARSIACAEFGFRNATPIEAYAVGVR